MALIREFFKKYGEMILGVFVFVVACFLKSLILGEAGRGFPLRFIVGDLILAVGVFFLFWVATFVITGLYGLVSNLACSTRPEMIQDWILKLLFIVSLILPVITFIVSPMRFF